MLADEPAGGVWGNNQADMMNRLLKTMHSTVNLL